jgi:putative SOS response-associated peptidase YedK
MCSIFDFKISKTLAKAEFNIELPNDITGRALPYTKAPVIRHLTNQSNNTKRYEIQDMNFSLVPHWSKDKKVKFATHNARLFGEDGTPIFSKPSWKIPFKKNHCLVIMDSFLESVHDGPYAGNVIAFKHLEAKPLIAAGIWDQSVDKASGEILESFAILTHNPPPFVQDAGHDRCPVFLKDNAVKEWLSLEGTSPQDQLEFLITHIEEKPLLVEIDRPLKNFKRQTEFNF